MRSLCRARASSDLFLADIATGAFRLLSVEADGFSSSLPLPPPSYRAMILSRRNCSRPLNRSINVSIRSTLVGSCFWSNSRTLARASRTDSSTAGGSPPFGVSFPDPFIFAAPISGGSTASALLTGEATLLLGTALGRASFEELAPDSLPGGTICDLRAFCFASIVSCFADLSLAVRSDMVCSFDIRSLLRLSIFLTDFCSCCWARCNSFLQFSRSAAF
mmetsp:Transcript_40155/g.74251  ORF Transcript_40155/g.74251 Transcript_40155/m.74251 type:complete len:219 (-) Transcript_40155:778-1434(-)